MVKNAEAEENLFHKQKSWVWIKIKNKKKERKKEIYIGYKQKQKYDINKEEISRKKGNSKWKRTNDKRKERRNKRTNEGINYINTFSDKIWLTTYVIKAQCIIEKIRYYLPPIFSKVFFLVWQKIMSLSSIARNGL